MVSRSVSLSLSPTSSSDFDRRPVAYDFIGSLGSHFPFSLLDLFVDYSSIIPPTPLLWPTLVSIILVFGRNNDRNVQRFVNGRFGDRLWMYLCMSSSVFGPELP